MGCSPQVRIQAPNNHSDQPKNDKVLTGAKILIVDDNTFNVYSLKLLIEESFKLTCDSAFSAKEAI